MRRPLLTLACLCLQVCFSNVYAQWTSAGSGISATPRGIQGLAAIDASTAWGVTINPLFTSAAREFTRTTNGGLTWQTGIIDAAAGQDFTAISICALDANTAWVAMNDLGTSRLGRLYHTANGGQTWTQQVGSFNDLNKALTAVHFFDANVGIAYGSPATGDPGVDVLRIWRTTNGGNTWTELNNLPNRLSGEGIFIYYGSGNYAALGDRMWIGTSRGRIWHTDDRGATWLAVSVGANVPVYAVAFKNETSGIAITDGQGFRTNNGGSSWSVEMSIPNALATYQISYVPNTPETYVLIYEGSNSFFSDFKFAFSSNDGSEWTTTDAIGIEVVQFLSPTQGWGGGQIFDATLGGMYKWTGDLDAITSVPTVSQMIADVQLYPNPFTDGTLVSFETKGNAPVEFVIRDITNKVLQREILQNPGAGRNQHRINLEAPTGMYFLTIRQADSTRTVKLFKR